MDLGAGGSPWSPLERLLYLLAIIIVIALIWPPISSEEMNQYKADADLDVARIQIQEGARRLQDTKTRQIGQTQ